MTDVLPELRDALEARALAGAGWLEIVVELAEVGSCEVRLAAADAALLCSAGGGHEASELAEQEDFDAVRPPTLAVADVERAFAADRPVPVRALDGLDMHGLAVRSGGRRVGVLLVSAPAARAGGLLRAASTAIAIVALRRDSAASAVAETAGWFVDELRFGSRRSAAEIAAMAQRFGVNLDEAQTAVAIGYDGADRQTFTTALSWVESPVRPDGPRAWTVLGTDARDRLTLIQRRLQSFVGTGRVLVAAGPPARGVEAIRGGFEKAAFALRLLGSGRTPTPRVPDTITFEELGIAGLLFAVSRTELADYVQERLAPVLDHAELLQTLRAWYASGGSRLSVAATTHIHRNSVGHRMERLRALLGVDPSDPSVAPHLQAALVAMDVLAARD